MKLEEYLGYMKEEWEFHKRNPVMFIVWATLAYGVYVIFKEMKP